MLANQTQILKEEFADLQKRSTQHYRSWKRSHQEKWRLLVETYLWWRKARAIEGFLDTVYSEMRIKWQKRKQKSRTSSR